MYCPKCYRKNDDSRTTCIKCGAKLRKAPLISKESAGKAFSAIKSEADKHGVTNQLNSIKADIMADVDKRAAQRIARAEEINNLDEAWRKTFKGLMTPEWTLTDKGIIFKNEFYAFSRMTRGEHTNIPNSSATNGVIQVYISGKNMPLTLAYSFKEKEEAVEAYEYILENLGDEEIKRQYYAQKERDSIRREKENVGLVYDLEGVRGRRLKVYGNKAVITVKKTVGAFITGNISDGEKTIYYRDCVGVQFKESGLQIGYLQLETASGIMNQKASNFFNENSFTYDTSVQSNEKMREVADYIRERVEAIKSGNDGGGQTVVNQISAADEIKKFKELLDLGIITQEEFDAKKKQLLGL